MFFKRKRIARHFEEIPFEKLENENGKSYDNMQLVEVCTETLGDLTRCYEAANLNRI